MRSPRSAFAALFLLLGTVVVLSSEPASAAAPAAPAAPATTNCTASVPAATDGRLTLDRSSVRPGESVLGVLSHFAVWPKALIGGGSGETFRTCTPWLPNGAAEVVLHDSSALFLVSVPAGTKAGTYQVSVLFYQGSTSAGQTTNKVRLTAPLTVTATPGAGASAACALTHSAAPAGSLSAPSSVAAGGSLSVTVTGVSSTSALNEYDHLYFVACLGGRATPVTFAGTPARTFTVPVPSGLTNGSYDLVVTGAYATAPSRPAVVSWRKTVTVTSAGGSELPITGQTPWLAAVLGLVLVAAGGRIRRVAIARHG